MTETPESYGTDPNGEPLYGMHGEPFYGDPDPGATRTVDDKGRVVVQECTDRELLCEVASNLRVVADVISQLGESPAIAAMMDGGNPMMAMLRNG